MVAHRLKPRPLTAPSCIYTWVSTALVRLTQLNPTRDPSSRATVRSLGDDVQR